ncbi:MAG: methylase [Ignavibacteria bacterium]|nr:methylase [Ignavibacteria bacterium]
MTITKRYLMKLNNLIRNLLFSRKWFINFIFNVKVTAPPEIQSYCEWGTIFQKILLKKYNKSSSKILEVGTGAHALLAIYAKKHAKDITVLATDILFERIKYAQENAIKNNCEIDFKVTDMFNGIKNKFDLILFNPPAIPSSELKKLGFELKTYNGLGSRLCWSGDGGEDGLDSIRSFLNNLAEHLLEHGKAILTVNPMHCSYEQINQISQKNDLKIIKTHSFFSIINAFIIEIKK